MLTLVVAIAAIAFAIRRVFFSPLSKIPGPKLAALTSLYYTFHEIRGYRHFFIDRLHRRYGPIVRIGPSCVSISDPAAVKEIYGVGSWDKPRGGWYTHFGAYGEDNMFSVWEGREHIKRKKVIVNLTRLNLGHKFDVQEDLLVDEIGNDGSPCVEHDESPRCDYRCNSIVLCRRYLHSTSPLCHGCHLSIHIWSIRLDKIPQRSEISSCRRAIRPVRSPRLSTLSNPPAFPDRSLHQIHRGACNQQKDRCDGVWVGSGSRREIDKDGRGGGKPRKSDDYGS
jgi:hypothetical protein